MGLEIQPFALVLAFFHQQPGRSPAALLLDLSGGTQPRKDPPEGGHHSKFS